MDGGGGGGEMYVLPMVMLYAPQPLVNGRA